MEFDHTKFTHPRILFDETQVAFGGGAATPLATNNLRTSRDMIVDLIGVSDETYSLNLGAAGNTFLQYIDLNWQVTERARWRPLDLARAIDLHNEIGDHSTDPTQADLAGWGMHRWLFSEPWLYGPKDGYQIDWSQPARAGGAATVARNITTMFDGVGVQTGARRTFQIPNFPIAGSAGGVLVTGTGTNTLTAACPGDEQYRITNFGIAFNAVAWAGTDLRVLNHMRIRVHPDVGDPWSEFPIPLIFYGPHMSPANRVCWHRPVGAPLLLKAGQGLVFELRNNHAATTTNVQVAILGRIAPGVGSIA